VQGSEFLPCEMVFSDCHQQRNVPPTKKRTKAGCPSILNQLLPHFLLTVARGNFKEAGVNDAL